MSFSLFAVDFVWAAGIDWSGREKVDALGFCIHQLIKISQVGKTVYERERERERRADDGCRSDGWITRATPC